MNEAITALAVTLWFVAGIAGYHLIAAIAEGDDEQYMPRYAWTVLYGPIGLLSAIIVIVRESIRRGLKEQSK